MFNYIKKNGLHLLEIAEFKKRGITAIFTTRKGGVSSGAYRELNLGLHTNDVTENVLENRRSLAAALSLNPADFTAGEQIHSNKVRVVTEKERGCGALDHNTALSNTDGLITKVTGLPLFSFYADCVPLFFMVPKKRIVGIAHAGWRGTVKKIGAKVIKKLNNKFGVKPSSCWVGIGPAIGPTHYEVDQKIIDQFDKTFSNIEDIVIKNQTGHYYLDLPTANYNILRQTGIPETQVILSDLDTYEKENLFYSYRRDKGETGRMAAVIYYN